MRKRSCNNRCGGFNNCCNNRYQRNWNDYSCGNGYYDFLFPMMFWLMRDCTRRCRCGWVNRYDQYRW